MSKSKTRSPKLVNETTDNNNTPRSNREDNMSQNYMDIKNKQRDIANSDQAATPRRNLPKDLKDGSSDQSPRVQTTQDPKPIHQHKRNSSLPNSRALEPVPALDWSQPTGESSRVSTGRNFTESRKSGVLSRQMSERAPVPNNLEDVVFDDEKSRLHRSESEPRLPASAV
jgi:hypothetical protein